MNKKILGSVLSLIVLVLPFTALAADLPSMVNKFAGQLALLTGGLAIIGFIVAGIMYITATANPGNMEKAKQALIAAVIGTVICILSASATGFVEGMFGLGGAGGGAPPGFTP